MKIIEPRHTAALSHAALGPPLFSFSSSLAATQDIRLTKCSQIVTTHLSWFSSPFTNRRSAMPSLPDTPTARLSLPACCRQSLPTFHQIPPLPPPPLVTSGGLQYCSYQCPQPVDHLECSMHRHPLWMGEGPLQHIVPEGEVQLMARHFFTN